MRASAKAAEGASEGLDVKAASEIDATNHEEAMPADEVLVAGYRLVQEMEDDKGVEGSGIEEIEDIVDSDDDSRGDGGGERTGI